MNLQQWHEHGDIFEFADFKIFYRVEGQGTPLLLIHGYPTASWDWVKVWPTLTDQFQCITLDMLGFGFSDKPQQKYSIMQQADIYCALLKKLGICSCHIISHDYGDTVAQELLARQHDGTLSFHIRSLHLLNGGLFAESHRPVLTQKLLLSPLGGLLVRLMKRATLAKNLGKVFAPDTQPSEQEINSFWQLICHNEGQLVMHKLIYYIVERRMYRERWVNALVEAKIPLRFTNGLLDPISGVHMVERYKQLVPNPDVVSLPKVGHYPQVEEPQQVLDAIQSFIK